MFINNHQDIFINFLLAVVLSLFSNLAYSESKLSPLPIFDAHIHYSRDVWEAIPPKEAIQRLRAIGVKRALVSSTSDEGTQKLYQADPSFVVPSLRPYRKRGTLDSWMYDESIIPYIKQRLEKYHYAAIGELHINGEQAYTPVMREIIRLAKQHQLMLHVHGDAKAIEFVFEQDPDAHVVWAHVGFDYAVIAHKLMDKYANLWADLSFRYEIINNGRIMPAWNKLLTEHADRFMLGIDTYTPLRWLHIKPVMDKQRELLTALPDDVARKIAYENGNRLIVRYDKLQSNQ